VVSTTIEGADVRLGLGNLEQLCEQLAQDEWARVIERHFDTLFRARAAEQAFNERAARFENVRDLVKLRLYGDGTFPDGAPRREVAPGLYALPCFDLPDTVATISADQLAGWALPDGELERVGLANLRAEAAPPVQEIDLDGVTIHALQGDSYFTASRALLLEEHLPRVALHGALVIVPHRHLVAFHLMETQKAFLAVNKLIPIVMNMHAEKPGPVSDRLYWWRAGVFTEIPARIVGTTLQVTPPPDFVDVLAKLPH
jgi:hypothetical protein